MSVDDELTRIEKRHVRVAVQVARSPRWAHAAFPVFMLASGALSVWFARRSIAIDPVEAFWGAALGGLMGGTALAFLADYRLQRALGVVYRRAAALDEAAKGQAQGAAGSLPAEARAPLSTVDPGPLRGACLVAFLSGLVVCGVAIWRFGGGDATPAWAGPAMGSAGGLGAGAALVASFLPRWMRRVEWLEARLPQGPPEG